MNKQQAEALAACELHEVRSCVIRASITKIDQEKKDHLAQAEVHLNMVREIMRNAGLVPEDIGTRPDELKDFENKILGISPPAKSSFPLPLTKHRK